MPKPAHLPFHLLAWGQQYVRVHNCYQFYTHDKTTMNTSTTSTDTSTTMNIPSVEKNTQINITLIVNTTSSIPTTTTTIPSRGGATQQQLDYFDPTKIQALDITRIPKSDLFDICYPGAITSSYNGPIKVVYLKKFDVGRHRIHRYHSSNNIANKNNTSISTTISTNNNTASSSSSSSSSSINLQKHPYPVIKYVYFTESDQIVYYDSFTTLYALSAASNDSMFIVGKRREKNRESNPEEYMSALNNWRECGTPGYSLTWPKSNLIQID